MSEKISKWSIDHSSYHARIIYHEFERETTGCYFENGRKMFKITGSREFFNTHAEALQALAKCLDEHQEKAEGILKRIKLEKEKLTNGYLDEARLIEEYREYQRKHQEFLKNSDKLFNELKDQQ